MGRMVASRCSISRVLAVFTTLLAAKQDAER